MLTDTGAHVVVADTHQADSVGHIGRQTLLTDALGQVVACDKLEGDGQVVGNQLVHAPFYLLFVLASRLAVKMKTHLALLAFHMGIIAALAAKHLYHGLIQQMFGCVGRRKLFLVMLVQIILFGHRQLPINQIFIFRTTPLRAASSTLTMPSRRRLTFISSPESRSTAL